MSDESPSQIHLRGKPLVFMAMAATVALVVVFLLGVMVGRGVPTARQAMAEPISADDPTAFTVPVDELGAKAVPARAEEAASLEYPEKPAPKAENRAAPAPGVDGRFLVQVAAYQRQGDAQSVQARLKRKGYPAYITTAATPAGTWFRVRVGGYRSRGEAQAVATKLKREERLEPWVTQ